MRLDPDPVKSRDVHAEKLFAGPQARECQPALLNEVSREGEAPPAAGSLRGAADENAAIGVEGDAPGLIVAVGTRHDSGGQFGDGLAVVGDEGHAKAGAVAGRGAN